MTQDAKIAHLQMIQGVINRMAGNSFLLKGWSVTLAAALFALAAANTNPLFVYLAYFPAIAFWLLDGYYVRQERLFRKLYERTRGPAAVDFTMSTKPFEPYVGSWGRACLSRTVSIFHGAVVGAIVVVAVLSTRL